MKLVAAIAVICVFGLCMAKGDDEGGDRTKWTPLQCRDGTLGPNDDRMKDLGACSETHGPEPGKKNINCIGYCQADGLGILNENGLPVEDIHAAWVKNTFPERHQSVATAWFRDCHQKYGKLLDLNDDECKMMKVFNDCTWGVQTHLTCP